MKLLTLCIILLTFTGCAILQPYSAKQVGKKVAKMAYKNPLALAKATRELYPCVTVDSTGKTDTIWREQDITWLMNIIDSLENLKPEPTETIIKPDSSCVILANKQVKYISKLEKTLLQVKDSLNKRPVIIQTNTITVRDSADIKVNQVQTQTIKDLEKKLAANIKYKYIFLIVALILLIGNILQFKFRI